MRPIKKKMHMPNVIHQNGGQINPATIVADRPASTRNVSNNGGILNFGLVSSLASGLVSAVQNANNRAWQEEQARIAYDRQVEQWKREAAYNSPAAQVARLRAAGINVNDAFSGQGASVAGGLSSVSTPSYTPLDIASSMAGMVGSMAGMKNAITGVGRLGLDTERLELDTERMRYLNALTDMQVNEVAEKVKNLSIDSSYKSVLLSYLDASEQIRLSRELAELQLTGSQKAYIDKQIQYYASFISSQITKNYADAENQRKGVEYMDNLIAKVKNETAHELVKMGLTEKQAKYYSSQAITSMIYGGINSLSNAASAVSSFLPFSGGNSVNTQGFDYPMY